MRGEECEKDRNRNVPPVLLILVLEDGDQRRDDGSIKEWRSVGRPDQIVNISHPPS